MTFHEFHKLKPPIDRQLLTIDIYGTWRNDMYTVMQGKIRFVGEEEPDKIMYWALLPDVEVDNEK